MPQQAHTTISHALATKVQRAQTPEDIREIIKLTKAEVSGLSWRPLGDRENNAGTVQIASSAALALIERVTNAEDALLEMLAKMFPGDMPGSPRGAAMKWFGVPAGGLAEMSDDDRRQLAEKLVVLLAESGDPDRPTVIVTDSGIGQHPLDAPDTLLSLNRSNKLGCAHMHGAYGQGAAATYRFAEYTLIITRRAPAFNGGREDLVGWTIVWEDPGDPNVDKLPVYRYLVGPDNDILTFNPSLLIDDTTWHGVRVAHVAYQLRGYTGAYNQPRNGIWALFHSSLFDPVLPFLVSGTREIDGRAAGKWPGASRVIVGNAARLNNPAGLGGDLELAYRNSVSFDVGKAAGQDYGMARINYWVVRKKASKDVTGDPVASFAAADAVVGMTLFGQRQDSESRAWLKANVQLPLLSRNLIAQIDVDHLSPLGKRELFASTRERAVDSDLRELLYKELAETMRSDSELRRLEHEERDRLLAQGAEAVDDKVRERLRKYIDTLLQNKKRKVKTQSTGPVPPAPGGPGGPKTQRDTDDSKLPNEPTVLRFAKDRIRVPQGGKTTVWVEIDATNGYLPRNESNLVVTVSPSAAGRLALVSRSELLGGKSLWKLAVELQAPIGDHEVEAVLVTANGVISDKTVIEVIPAPAKTTKVEKEEPEKGPQVKWIKEVSWPRLNWTAKTVGEVQANTDETLILVNRDQRLLRKTLESKKLSEAQVTRRAQRYLLPVACALVEQHQAVLENKTSPPSDEYVEAEMERLAGAVILAITEDALEDVA